MVGEIVFLTDINSFCQWTNTFLVAVTCIPFLLIALLHRIIPRRQGRLFKVEWNEGYFERRSLNINHPEDTQKKRRVAEDEERVPFPGAEDRPQSHIKKQAL